MNKRSVIKDIEIAREIYPVIFIMGPKGVGKTSFAIDITKNFYSFDDVHTYLSAKKSPYDFVSNLKTPCVIDEVQKIPEIFTFIEKEIEKNREIGVKYILTSSVDLLKNNLLKNSLQNAAFFKFLPLTLKEIYSKENENPVDELFNKRFLDKKYSYIPRNEILEHILKGGFPEVLKIKKNIPRFLWYANYTNIAILKNAIETFELRNYDKFLLLLTILAKNSADVINKSEIYQSAGIDNKTLDTYLKFLENSFHITLLKSFKPLPEDKKIVKSPKLFFQDTGLLCYLLGIKTADELAKSPYVENIFMTFIFSEIIKHINISDSITTIFFYRTILKKEINFILKRENKTIAINVKFSSTVLPHDFKIFRKILTANDLGIVLYNGEEVLSFNKIKGKSTLKQEHDNLFAVPISIFF